MRCPKCYKGGKDKFSYDKSDRLRITTAPGNGARISGLNIETGKYIVYCPDCKAEWEGGPVSNAQDARTLAEARAQRDADRAAKSVVPAATEVG